MRRSIPSHEKTLDPRLRRILRLKDDPLDAENQNKFSTNESEIGSPTSASITQSTTTSTISSLAKSRLDPRSDPRNDPRRSATANAAAAAAAASNTSSTNQVLNQSNQQRSLHLDIQNILQKSDWYKECSSKQKIMVNQQLAIVSTELKKFHTDPSDTKIFDLTFILQNQVLQGVLTNLGVFISENGEFMQLDKNDSNDSNELNLRNQSNNLVDLMSMPMRQNLDINMDYLRNQQQHHQQAAVMQQAMNVMNAQQHLFAGLTPAQAAAAAAANATNPLLAYGNIQSDVIRPGLLGIAPNIPFGGGQFDQFFNRSSNNNDNRHRNSGGNRWVSGTSSGNSGNNNSGNNSNNSNRDQRRNQYDRNSSRRDKK